MSESWAIGILQEPIERIISSQVFPPVIWLGLPRSECFADPFALTHGQITYIFFEDYSYQTGKGHISVVETKDMRTFSQPRAALKQPFHLSYPFVLNHNGRFFMVPEQFESGQVDIYEAEKLPDQWVKRATLISGFPGIDPTLVHYNDRWWMFIGNHIDAEDSNLFIFHADHLLGPWHPHSKRPAQSNRHISRSAGTPFLFNGCLMRPCQDSTRTYGGKVIINQITTLDEYNFEEQRFTELAPFNKVAYSEGLHTVTSLGDFTLIDAKVHISK